MYTLGMRTTVRTWGNSLAVRIPKAFALHVGIASGKHVELSVGPDGLHIAPSMQSLDDLLAAVTAQNLHGETMTGPVQGREIW